jgi:hypothetical protein
MNEETPFFDLMPSKCKLVELVGGRSDGIVTGVHVGARWTQRPQGLYAQTNMTSKRGREIWAFAGRDQS